MTLSLMTLSVLIPSVIYAECHNAECRGTISCLEGYLYVIEIIVNT
jgi:hypothetical protein